LLLVCFFVILVVRSRLDSPFPPSHECIGLCVRRFGDGVNRVWLKAPFLVSSIVSRRRSEYRPVQNPGVSRHPQVSYPLDYYLGSVRFLIYHTRFLRHFASLLRRLLSLFFFRIHIISCIRHLFLIYSLSLFSSIFYQSILL